MLNTLKTTNYICVFSRNMNSVVKTALVTGAVLAALAVVTSGQTAASTGAGDTQCVNLTNAEFFVLVGDMPSCKQINAFASLSLCFSPNLLKTCFHSSHKY